MILPLHDLMTHWDMFYNSPLIADPTLDYIAVSVLRLLVVWAAWRMLQALWRYANAALPTPHTLDNISYWLRWWLWLRLQDRPLLKLSASFIALAALGQIFGGVAGKLNDFSPYFLVMCGSLVALFIALSREFHALSFTALHPGGAPNAHDYP